MKQSTVYYTDFRVRGGQTLQQKLDRLVEAGFVTRTQDPACRRCQKIALTESGRLAAERVAARFKKLDARFRAALSEEEARQLLEYLNRLYQSLQNPAWEDSE